MRAEVTLENETLEFRKVTSWAENKTFRLCLETTFMNSVWILFWENFYKNLLRNIFFEERKLKIIALIYGRFDLIAFRGELTLRFWQTFRIYERKVHLDKVGKDKRNLVKWQVGQKVNVSNFVEDNFYEFWLNSVAILFLREFLQLSAKKHILWRQKT